MPGKPLAARPRALNVVERFRLHLADLLWPPNLTTSRFTCANRHVRVMHSGWLEITVTYRDTREPDGYSKEELVEMLDTVRKHERLMGWRVPDDISGEAYR